jgi:hypothetical protein
MRILIQDGVSKRYFNSGAWELDVDRATDFENVAKAEQLCQEQNLNDALIVLKFKDTNNDISYPVGSPSALLFGKSFTKRSNAF